MNIKKLGFVSAMALGSIAFVTSCNQDPVQIYLDGAYSYAFNYGTNTCDFVIQDKDTNVKWGSNVSANDFELKGTKLEGKTISSITRTSDKVLTVKFNGNITNDITGPDEIEFNIKGSAFSGAKVTKCTAPISLFRSCLIIDSSSQITADTDFSFDGYMYGVEAPKYPAKFDDITVNMLKDQGKFSSGGIHMVRLNTETENIRFQLNNLTYSDQSTNITFTLKKENFARLYTGIDADLTIELTRDPGKSLDLNTSTFYFTKAS